MPIMFYSYFEADLYLITFHNLYCRGDDFRLEYAKLQQIRSILHPSVHIMALTATATRATRNEIAESLGMHNIAIVYISPNKQNIRYVVRKFETIEKTFGPVADEIAKQQESLGRVVIFCQTVSDCCMLYRFFRHKLGVKFTLPNGSDDKCKNRIVDMFHSDTEPCIKEEIIENFSKESHHLHVVIATIAFGMGVDVPNIRTVIHFGASDDEDMYIQAVGRAGRDGKLATAILLVRRGGRKHTSKLMTYYSDNTSICRRHLLFSDYDEAEQSTSMDDISCVCCDICYKKCNCGNCSKQVCDNVL